MYGPTSYGYRHPYFCAGVRIAAATWQLILGSIFIAHGYRWGAVLYGVAALILVAAYVFARGNLQARRNARG